MNNPDASKMAKSRSPAYPSMALPSAVELARKLWNGQRKQEAHVDSALKALGYSARSGTALRTLAALSHFGLTEESGAKDDRKIRLSESAQDILHLDEGDPRRKKAIFDAAIEPSIYAALWERYGANLPDDAAIRPFLIRDKGYNESIVSDLLADYRTTLEFAKADKIAENNPDDDRGTKRDASPSSGRADHDSESAPKRGAMTVENELPILVGSNRVARIPFPMTEDDFDLLLGTLNLWKKKLLFAKPTPDAKGQTDHADQG